MQLETSILSEVNQKEKYDTTYVEPKKWYKWTYLQNRNILTDFKNKHMVTKEERWQEG